MNPGFIEPNVSDEEPFSNAVSMALQALGRKKCRVALSLCDAVGKTLVTTLDEPPKRGREGINLVLWHIREQLPLAPDKIRLAYQVIDTEPNGKTRVLIAAAAREVLEQYENLLTASGAIPSTILFESLSLMHLYHAQGVPDGPCLFILWSCAALTLQLFANGRLLACRSRPAPHSETLLFQEVSRTLTDWERAWPEVGEAPVFLHATAGGKDWGKTLQGALGRALQPALQPQWPLVDGGLAGKPPTPDVFGAIGAAECLAGAFGNALLRRG
jgi:hypothetical protein